MYVGHTTIKIKSAKDIDVAWRHWPVDISGVNWLSVRTFIAICESINRPQIIMTVC